MNCTLKRIKQYNSFAGFTYYTLYFLLLFIDMTYFIDTDYIWLNIHYGDITNTNQSYINHSRITSAYFLFVPQFDHQIMG